MTDHDDQVIGPIRRPSPAPDELRAVRLHQDHRLASELRGAHPDDRRHRMFSAVLRDFLFGVLIRMDAQGTLHNRVAEPNAHAHSSERIPPDMVRSAATEAVTVFMAERLTTGAWSLAGDVTIQEDVVAHGLRALSAAHRRASREDEGRPTACSVDPAAVPRRSPLVESVVEVLASTEPTVVALAVLRAAGDGLGPATEALGVAVPVLESALQRFWNRIAAARAGRDEPPPTREGWNR